MRSGGQMFKGVSREEREAINARERNELAEKIQLTEQTEQKAKAMRTGGRKLLLFDSILGTTKSQTGTATMGSRG